MAWLLSSAAMKSVISPERSGRIVEMLVDSNSKEKNKPHSKHAFQIIAEQINKSALVQAMPVPSSKRNNTPN
jgi:hypothetical protein